jgi:hypothetical protein
LAAMTPSLNPMIPYSFKISSAIFSAAVYKSFAKFALLPDVLLH